MSWDFGLRDEIWMDFRGGWKMGYVQPSGPVYGQLDCILKLRRWGASLSRYTYQMVSVARPGCAQPGQTRKPSDSMPGCCHKVWVAVKEFSLSYYNGETILIITKNIYTHPLWQLNLSSLKAAQKLSV